MGVGQGIGIDMVESENTPTLVNVLNKAGEPQAVMDFATGQNTMMVRDT